MIYLDANATSPPDPEVVQAMLPFLTQHFGNPSAAHAAGRAARKAAEKARAQVAALMGAEPSEILFTSGATESINTVHLSVRQTWPDKPLLIISAVEHPAVIESAARWQQQGGRVKKAPVKSNGVVDLDALATLLEPGQTALVSIIWANNETGVIQPMAEIAALAHKAGALVHADAVQLAGKLPFSIAETPVDYLSLGGHKMHAPKGIGALYVSRHTRLQPLLLGGGQERGFRSGTENVAGMVALGQAAELAPAGMRKLPPLHALFESELKAALPDIRIHGEEAPRLPNTSSVHFPALDGPSLIIRLDQKGIACSGGSACHTASLHPSHVLEAMGYDAMHASSTLRFSLSRLNTEDEIRKAVAIITAAVHHLRAQWDSSSLVLVN